MKTIDWLILGLSENEIRALPQEQKLLLIQEMKLYEKAPAGVEKVGTLEMSVHHGDIDIDSDNDGISKNEDNGGDDEDDYTDKGDTHHRAKRRRRGVETDVNSGGAKDGPSSTDSTDSNFHVSISQQGLQISIMTIEQAHLAYDVFDDIRPKYVILYDPDVETIRQIEVYQARR